MRSKGPQTGGPRKKNALARGLLLCMTFTLLTSMAFGVWSYLSRKHTIVLDPKDIEMIQLDPPKAGDKIAVMHTTAGDLTFQLYPEQAPKAVANFCELAEKGYYDGTYVFRVEPGTFFAAGSADAEGHLPEGVSGTAQERVRQELSPKLWPLRGSLCALTTCSDTGFWKNFFGTATEYNGSRFMVLDTIEMTDEIIQGLRESESEGSKKVADALVEKGGIPNYAQSVTIFGQMIDGFDILDAITDAKLQGSGEERRPKEDIIITSVEITAYQEENVPESAQKR
ncbi:MAG: peptidylprolyl isomerase [Oscillospiraceae bacterium]|nr:peptidylprolyl isomerase [Oscillospiraceae bacterium]